MNGSRKSLLILAFALWICAVVTGLVPVVAAEPIAPRLTLSDAATPPLRDQQSQRHPAAAGGGGVCLLVWQEGFNGQDGKSDILALRLGPDGTPLDKDPIRVCSAAGVQDNPAVAFCGGKFLVVWSDMRNGVDYDIYAASVTPAGTVEPRDGFLLAGGKGGQTCPAVASNGRDQFLVVWQGFRGEGFGIFGARVSAVSGEAIDKESLPVMARGERPAVTWNGVNYVVCQKWHAALVGLDGQLQKPSAQTWNSKTVGWSSAAAAWGRSFVFFDTEPYPDPWGWGGNGSIVGVSVAPSGDSPERGWAAGLKDLQAAKADGRVKNCLDACQWRDHPGWPMGMRGGLKGTHDGLWPSGQIAAAFNGRSLVCVWPRAHMVDNRRLADRDLYLTRVLPDWGLVDRPPVKIVAGPTEETNPAMCAGATGQVLLAYEKVVPTGVVVEYRWLIEAEDREPPRVAYVVPTSDTEMIVAFDEPVDAASASTAGNFVINGLAVKAVAFNTDNRGLQREVILTTEAPVRGKTYTLRVTGVKDRSPGANAAAGATVAFLAKPGVFLRGDFIDRWSVLGPLARDTVNHPLDPATAQPAPGEKVGEVAWTKADGAVLDFGDRFGEKPDLMAYAAVYLFSDRPREATLRLDTNDHNRSWLNGKLVYDGITKAVGSRGFHDYRDEIPIALLKGWNRLLVQVENLTGAWLLVGQVTDAAGFPLRDLTWQVELPAGG